MLKVSSISKRRKNKQEKLIIIYVFLLNDLVGTWKTENGFYMMPGNFNDQKKNGMTMNLSIYFHFICVFNLLEEGRKQSKEPTDFFVKKKWTQVSILLLLNAKETVQHRRFTRAYKWYKKYNTSVKILTKVNSSLCMVGGVFSRCFHPKIYLQFRVTWYSNDNYIFWKILGKNSNYTE